MAGIKSFAAVMREIGKIVDYSDLVQIRGLIRKAYGLQPPINKQNRNSFNFVEIADIAEYVRVRLTDGCSEATILGMTPDDLLKEVRGG